MSTVRTTSPGDTLDLGRRLGRELQGGDVVALLGTLGSGKTCLVTGICDGLGVRAPVASPTFTLVNEYTAPWGAVIHVDLYRIGSRAELAELGLEEYFTPRTVCLIEWAELVLDLLPRQARIIRIAHGEAPEERLFTL